MADPQHADQAGQARAANQPAPDAAQAGRPPELDASLYLHPQTLARLGSFELRAKMIVEGLSSGHHRSPYQGLSVEFKQHRAYAPGDDLRHLDWKVFARTDRLHLKQHQQETTLDLVILCDASGSMGYGSRSFAEASGVGRTTSLDGRDHWSKYDHATALAAAIAYITLRQGDRVGLAVFADELKTLVKRSSSMGTWRQVVGALSTHPVDASNRNRPTRLDRVIDQAMGSVTNRCLVAIISDLFVEPTVLRDALARLRFGGHDVILFQILDKAEENFAFTDAAPFEGLEGEAMIRVDPRAIRDAYLGVLHEHTRQVEALARTFGFDYQRFSTHDWLGPALAAFVAKRNAMLKGRLSG